MANENPLDVLNAALAESGQPQPNETDEEVVTNEAPDTGDGLGEVADGAGDDAVDESQGEEGAGEEGAEGDEGVERNIEAEAAELGIATRDKGRFKSKEQLTAEVDAAKKANATADAAKAKVGLGAKPVIDPATGKPVEKKAADPINDPIPKDAAQSTQDRIRTLIDRTKEAETKYTTMEQNFNYLVEGVKATGASPEQYGETLNWLSLFNSGDPKSQGKALEIIENVADQLATMLGVERKIADPLAAHLDLQQAVQKGQITAQYAKDLARSRNGAAFQAQMRTASTERAQTEAQQFEAAKETARVDLNELESLLRDTDPNYERKKAVLLPKLQQEFKSRHPSEWKSAFQRLYKEVKVAAPAPKPRTVVPGSQPLRAGRTPNAGSATAKPNASSTSGNVQDDPAKAGLDALNSALASFSR